MSQSLVELAQQELEEHGMEMEEPDRVRNREEMELNDLVDGFEPGVRSASYKAISDTMTLYEPVAKQAAVEEVLDEEELEELFSMVSSGEGPEILQKSARNAFETMNHLKKGIEMTGLQAESSQRARNVAAGRAIYDALTNGMEAESVESPADLNQEFRNQLQSSAEHELIHKYAVDAFVDPEKRTGRLVANLEEIAALETRELYGENTDTERREIESKKAIKEQGFPQRELDLYRAAVIEIEGEAYEEKKEELREKDNPHEKLENYLDQRTEELEEEIQEYLQPVFERAQGIGEVPVGSVGESFAHFWNMYRDGTLEDDDQRERKKEGLRKNYPEGGKRAAQVIDELFQRYDELGGTEKERVTEIMTQQEKYLEDGMDRTLVDRVTDRLTDSDYLPF